MYRFRVRAQNALGLGPFSPLSVAGAGGTPATVPGAPTIGTATSGASGGAVTASVTWTPPADNGGQALTSYTVRALRVTAAGQDPPISTTVFPNIGVNVNNGVPLAPAGSRSTQLTLPAGQYQFQVVAVNGTVSPLGSSAPSARSNLVTAQ